MPANRAEIEIPHSLLTCGRPVGITANGTIVLCTRSFGHSQNLNPCNSPLLSQCVSVYWDDRLVTCGEVRPLQ